MTRAKLLLALGIIFLIIGLALNFVNLGGDNATIAQQATNAQEAALAISANNQKMILINAISMFLIGLGISFIAIPALKFLKKKN